MEYLLIVIVALLLIIAIVVVFNFLGGRKVRQAEIDALHERAHRPADPFTTADDDAVRGNPRDLKPGALIDLRGQTFAVRGVLRLSQSGYVWTEAFLDTGTGRKAWISVEDDPDLEVVLWQELVGVTLTPGPTTVDLDGHRYVSEESGTAQFTSSGTTGLAAAGSMRYHDYQAGNERLSFEDFGSGWESARGEVLQRGDYRIYPASSTPDR